MGYIFAHLHCGEEVLKKIGYETRSRRLFNFGSMGPDFLFAESVDMEKLLHNEKAEEFANFLLQNKSVSDYALGYATHIFTDKEMYPALMKFAKGDFDEYVRLSLAFDMLLARNVYNLSIEKVNLASKIDVGKNLPKETEEALKSALKAVYNTENIDFNGAYQKFIRFLYATYDPFLVKRMAYPLVKLITKFDIYKFTYPILPGDIPKGFYEDVYESMQRGIRLGAEKLKDFAGT